MPSFPFDLSGKRILITGASSGIGQATCVRCSEAGASVLACARSHDKLLETLSMMTGDCHQIMALDLCNTDLLFKAVSDIPYKFDGVVFGAGIGSKLPARFIDEAAILKIFSININSIMILTSQLLRQKKLNDRASLVMISSITSGRSAYIGNSIYGASKGAVEAYAKTLALELLPRKIRVNTILPGMIETSFYKEMGVSQEQLELDKARYPLGYGKPEDVANAAVFFLSDASKWITGSELLMDGGLTLK